MSSSCGHISSRTRRNIKRRLLIVQDRKCFYCNGEAVRPTLDHVIPVAHGGREAKLFVVACFPCNQSKGSNLPDAETVLRATHIRAQAMRVPQTLLSQESTAPSPPIA
jgi:5-methylcytosine-specific restriction endonuclease McrA